MDIRGLIYQREKKNAKYNAAYHSFLGRPIREFGHFTAVITGWSEKNWRIVTVSGWTIRGLIYQREKKNAKYTGG